jgi:LuxR family maltose regulon positive regulatory protein
MGDTQQVEQALAEMDGPERESGEIRNAIAVLRLAQGDPKAATTALAPVMDGSVPLTNAHLWVVQAFLLEAIARDALGDADAARYALERALDSAESQFLLLPFLFTPAPELFERHRRHGSAHAALISAVLNELTGRKPVVPAGELRNLHEALTPAETRVLRYLPTNLTVPEIAGQLYLSVNTVRTHMRHVYDKLGTHRRGEAVERARALGLLAPSTHGLSPHIT